MQRGISVFDWEYWLACYVYSSDLSTVHSFLLSYSNKPVMDHMKAALYALHYTHSTFDFGISFTSDSVAPMHLYIHHPPLTDIEAFTNAVPPTPTTSPTISAYSNACWGSQIGSAVWRGPFSPCSNSAA